MPNESVRPRSRRGPPARWWLLVVPLTACKGSPVPRAPEIVAAPILPSSAEPSAATPEAPGSCSPRSGFAALSFTVGRSDRKGKHGVTSASGPRFSTTDPELAGSVAAVQAAIDGWLKDHGPGNLDTQCGPNNDSDCAYHQDCEVTRNDGAILSVLCTNQVSVLNWRGGVLHDAFLFRRTGKTFSRVTVEAFASNPKVSLVARTLPLANADEDIPFDPSPKAQERFDGGGAYYATLHDIDLEVGSRDSTDENRHFAPFSKLSSYLTCDAVLDMPAGPPAVATSETGALAVATSILEGDDPGREKQWGTPPTIERPRFVALEARHAAAAKLLNDAIDGYFAAIQARAKAEIWYGVEAFCRVETSTDKLASVLCHGGGDASDGSGRKTARGSITVLLGATPQRVDAATIFARHPDAPAQIARHCLGSLVRRPTDPSDEVLRALPRLTAADLRDFAVAQTGIFFAVEYDLAKRRRLMPCHVPHRILGTSLEALSAP